MRYEDIRANPEQEIRRIADFLEISDLSDDEFSQVPVPQLLLFAHMVLCCGSAGGEAQWVQGNETACRRHKNGERES